MRPVYVIGTADTKGAELRYVRDLISEQGVPTVLVDVSTAGSGIGTGADVGPDEVAAHHPDGAAAVRSQDRGDAVAAMAVALEHFLVARSDQVGGVLGLGGSGGTALITPAMRALDVGVPKTMVSTVASGDVGAYVGPADIAMTYSVTDVAGLNRISRVVLGNAAHAIAGMVAHPIELPEADRPAVGLTMFGVTTPLVTMLGDRLAGDWEPLIFHATGTGGQSMEKLADSGLLAAVLDTTTTEIADHIVGGVFSAGAGRLDAIARSAVPWVGSIGACDMVNFTAQDTVPERFADRLLHVHNANVTLMRTTAEECRQIGAFIADKLNACPGPVRLLLPTRGVSMLDAPGQAFHDPEADEALMSTLEERVQQTEDRTVVRVDAHINDEAFADALLAAFAEVTGPPGSVGAPDTTAGQDTRSAEQ